uniref:C3H1-type domain-containing protein n=1 Tax=Stomoxys calcitrans TaxID=35570 RepID=A0A1I8QD08_STOCA
MLPQNYNNPRTIHINPNFKGQRSQSYATSTEASSTSTCNNSAPPPVLPASAHINPLFLEKNKRPTIHMNPQFLFKLQEQRPQTAELQFPKIPHPTPVQLIDSFPIAAISKDEQRINTYEENRKIICKSKNRLVREPVASTRAVVPPKANNSQPPIVVITNRKLIRKSAQTSHAVVQNQANTSKRNIENRTVAQPQPIVVVTRRKLIRKSALPVSPPTPPSQMMSNSLTSKTHKTRYKLDNRTIKKNPLSISPSGISRIRRKSFVGRFALLRRNSTTQIASANSWRKTTNIQSMNKKLQLLNINGLLYKSTRNTLQLKDLSCIKAKKATEPTKPQTGLTIFVQGTKYIMDPQKFKLTRVVSNDKENPTSKTKSLTNCRQRIDIGGYTYVSAPTSKNVLVRTSNHLARAYVNNAKHKSLQLLTKRLVKSNVPCPIYQRVGKCAAFERGKCFKVHNKQQVAICPKFLRGECINSACLMSHEVSLSKMPVCKFYMQGVCVRNDCPYLHKKLSSNAEVCIDFLRGFCQLAEKCKRRHEFVCPELERSGQCTITNCLYCKGKVKKDKFLEKKSDKSKNIDSKNQLINSGEHSPNAAVHPMNATKETIEKTTGVRYFIGPSEEVLSRASDTGILSDNQDNENETESLAEPEEGMRKRPKLGNLPAFIPL